MSSEEYSSEELEAAILAAQNDFLIYCMLVWPNFVVGPHHRLIADAFMDLYNGDITRLMVFMAPRSGKSQMGSIFFPSYCIGRKLDWQFLSVAYSRDLAMDWSREVRNLIQTDEYRAIFPGITLRADSRAAGRWHTGGGGVFHAAGIGAGIAGRGANLAIIDDPLSEQDAYSKSSREHVIRWYPGGLRTRLQAGGRIAIIQTRWHEEDLSGYLLQLSDDDPLKDQWRVIDIPAILDEKSAASLEAARLKLIEQGIYPENSKPMRAGESYWPILPENKNIDTGLRGWSIEELLKTKSNLPDYQWSALYMQNPVPEEGGIIKKGYWTDWIDDKPPFCDYLLLSCDTAFSTGQSSDYSAILTWGVFKDNNDIPNLILLGAKRGRWEFPELRKQVLELYNFHEPDMILIEKKASGQSLIQELTLAGLPVFPWQPDKDKTARAHACTPILNAGRIWVPRRKLWAEEVINECANFPNGAHDDYVDCLTQAVLWLRGGAWVYRPDESEFFERPQENTKRRFYY